MVGKKRIPQIIRYLIFNPQNIVNTKEGVNELENMQ